MTDVGIGLGGHDPSVAGHAAELYHRGLIPLIVFTGATSPVTAVRFPRGEAVHYREIVLALGVPDEVILVEPAATNTGQNIEFSRELLAGRDIRSVTLITKPQQARRGYATCRKVWPEVEVVCSFTALPFDDYVESIGDTDLVLTSLVGETQRVWTYAEQGFAIEQDVPADVRDAFATLVAAGYTDRLIR
ncbi:YdcF family protein [Nocardia asteroides]|uniref:YdcF family protein n=1 Tax=Nocardia asteroides TaxID=1824 RepID=UPI001E591FFE|nr:YdcF family protein [Nocardia asteroides]UGT64337.1 YdcF family protein [Nocardia asteroides]